MTPDPIWARLCLAGAVEAKRVEKLEKVGPIWACRDRSMVPALRKDCA